MRKVHGKRKEDGLKRERENERNEGLGREGEKCRFWRESGKKSKRRFWRKWLEGLKGKERKKVGCEREKRVGNHELTANKQTLTKTQYKHKHRQTPIPSRMSQGNYSWLYLHKERKNI